MNKPTDPRKHGLKNPHKILREERHLYVRSNNLFDYVKEWEENLASLIKDEWRVVDGPKLSMFDGKLLFSIQKENVDYNQQLSAYNEAIEQYEKDLDVWKKATEDKQKKIDKEDIHEKIARTEARLAKLKAVRDNEIEYYI